MRNIVMNFYCDYVFLIGKNIFLIDKLVFLFNKYLYLFLHLFKINLPVKLLGKVYHSSDQLGLLGFQIMFKDFYDYYYMDLGKDPVIFDVGAFIGNFALVSNVLYEGSKIFSFEPVSETYSLLDANTEGYSNIETHNIALGDFDGKKTIYFTSNSMDRSSFEKNSFSKGEITGSQEINVSKMSSFVIKNKIPRIDLLKVDVEGVEYQVLKGSLEILDRVNNIIVEIHTGKEGDVLGNVCGLLSDYGFKLVRVGKIWQGYGRSKALVCMDLIFGKK